YTTTHYSALGAINLTGVASDQNGVSSVAVGVAGANLSAGINSQNGTWIAPWLLSGIPDGVSYPLVITATDRAGRVTTLSDSIVVDIVPPSLTSVSIAYTNANGLRTTLSPNDTIYDVNTPALLINWASDSTDLAHFDARWTPTITPTALTALPASAREYAQTVGEAQRWFAHISATDQHGNQVQQTLGPVIADFVRTPDYITLEGRQPYAGWLDSGCTLIGVDRRVQHGALANASLKSAQQLYLSWDASALRMAWTGADWNRDGDL